MSEAAAGLSCNVVVVSVRKGERGDLQQGGGYSCLTQLCVVSLEGVLSGVLLRPAGKLKCSPPCTDFFCPSAINCVLRRLGVGIRPH